MTKARLKPAEALRKNAGLSYPGYHRLKSVAKAGRLKPAQPSLGQARFGLAGSTSTE